MSLTLTHTHIHIYIIMDERYINLHSYWANHIYCDALKDFSFVATKSHFRFIHFSLLVSPPPLPLEIRLCV